MCTVESLTCLSYINKRSKLWLYNNCSGVRFSKRSIILINIIEANIKHYCLMTYFSFSLNLVTWTQKKGLVIQLIANLPNNVCERYSLSMTSLYTVQCYALMTITSLMSRFKLKWSTHTFHKALIMQTQPQPRCPFISYKSTLIWCVMKAGKLLYSVADTDSCYF